jgi:hypothetical protein
LAKVWLFVFSDVVPPNTTLHTLVLGTKRISTGVSHLKTVSRSTTTTHPTTFPHTTSSSSTTDEVY